MYLWYAFVLCFLQIIRKEDIVQGVLWHESNGSNFNRRPLNQFQKIKSITKIEDEVIYKNAAIGWGGRGRGEVFIPSASQISFEQHRQVSELNQGFKSLYNSGNQSFRQLYSTSSSSEQFRWWKNANTNISWTKGQSSSSSYSARKSSQEKWGGCQDGRWSNDGSWRRGKSFSSLSAHKPSNGRANYQPNKAS